MSTRRGSETHYHFEYGPSACTPEPSTCSSTPEQDAGKGYADVSAVEEVTGLPAGTYHYRIVASGLGKASEERTFTILASPADALADGRQWQMVSPPEKEGNEPEPMTDNGSTLRASEAGSAITYARGRPDGDRRRRQPQPRIRPDPLHPRAGRLVLARPLDAPRQRPRHLARKAQRIRGLLLRPGARARWNRTWATCTRGSSPNRRWRRRSRAHEQELQAEGKEYQEKSIYLRANPPLEPEAAEAASFEQALANGTLMGNPGYLPLVNEENAPGHPFGGGFKIPHNLGVEFTLLATPDLSHVVFKSWKAAPGVYEWGPGEHIQLVSLLPEAGAVSCTAATCKPLAPEEVRTRRL